MIPDESTLKSYLYYRLQPNELYPSWKQTKYYCDTLSYTKNCSSGQTEYLCFIGKDDLNVQGDNVGNATGVLTFCDGVYKGSYAKYGTVSQNSQGYSNVLFSHKFTNNKLKKDLLLETDYYQKKRDEELKTLLKENSSSSTEIPSLDMTSTNNILYTIALILCVILLVSFLRRLFNRGVK